MPLSYLSPANQFFSISGVFPPPILYPRRENVITIAVARLRLSSSRRCDFLRSVISFLHHKSARDPWNLGRFYNDRQLTNAIPIFKQVGEGPPCSVEALQWSTTH
ncbi:hypothetical protein TIFTF001_017037 [Ficus carica]|uniref:Uncharacterized protein n=1 Tax=Ficus carica TaxID=3494 RepID=A0AA88DAD2_FICCA|nr:hypothetical protein TIFTF001_017037 [Ficus carica]